MNRRTLAIIQLGIMIIMGVALAARRTPAQIAATNGFGYTHISGAATTQVATIGQTLHTITINTPGTLATLYDNAAACSTTTIAAVTTTGVGTLTFDLQLKNGLCIVTTGAGTDLTVTTR